MSVDTSVGWSCGQLYVNFGGFCQNRVEFGMQSELLPESRRTLRSPVGVKIHGREIKNTVDFNAEIAKNRDFRKLFGEMEFEMAVMSRILGEKCISNRVFQ